MFTAASRFIILKNLQVNHVDATSPESSYEDAAMKLNYVTIMPNDDAKLPRSASSSPIEEEDVTNYYCREKGNPGELSVVQIIRIEM